MVQFWKDSLNISLYRIHFGGSWMSTSCEYVAKHFLPLYRAFVAKELIEHYGYTQVQAAEKLGTTQPAVSQYLSAKRGRKASSNYDEVEPLMKAVAAEAAESVAKTKMTPEEFSDSFCDLCRKLQKDGKIPKPRRRTKKK
jgi:predicted transcriptional regulator